MHNRTTELVYWRDRLEPVWSCDRLRVWFWKQSFMQIPRMCVCLLELSVPLVWWILSLNPQSGLSPINIVQELSCIIIYAGNPRVWLADRWVNYNRQKNPHVMWCSPIEQMLRPRWGILGFSVLSYWIHLTRLQEMISASRIKGKIIIILIPTMQPCADA